MNAVSGGFPDGIYSPHPESIRNMAAEFADGREDGALDPEGGRAYSGGMNVEEKALSTFRTEPRPFARRWEGRICWKPSPRAAREERLTGYAAPCMEPSCARPCSQGRS